MTTRAPRQDLSRKVAQTVKGAIKGGLKPGTFEVRTDNGEVRILPCAPIEAQSSSNPWDEVLPGAA